MKMKVQEKRIFRILILVLAMLIVAIPISWQKTYAASSSVSISDDEPDVGDSFTVTIYYSGDTFGSADGALTYDASVLRYEDSSAQQANGGNGEISFSHYQSEAADSMAISFFFTVIASGSSSVTAVSSDIYNYDGNSLGGGSASASFTVPGASNTTPPSGSSEGGNESENENRPKSSNANLSVFSIACGEITPAFSPDVTSYSVTAGPTETDVDITAIPEDENAEVTFGGSPILTEDEVTRVVTVTAEDGTQKSYSIKITRSNPTGAIIYNGTLYTPSENLNQSEVPSSFLASKLNFKGKDLNILKSRDGNVNLIKLKPEGGSEDQASWFVFNPETQSFAPSEIITVDGNKYVVVRKDVDLVYGGTESAGGYQVYDAETGKLSSITMDVSGQPAPTEPSETPSETEPTETNPSEGTTPTPEENTSKKGRGLLWFILLLVLALVLALLYMMFRDKFTKKNNEYFDDDEEDAASEKKFLSSLAGLKDSMSSKLSSRKSNNNLYDEEAGMSERRIERRRRIAEAEAKAAAGGGVGVSTGGSAGAGDSTAASGSAGAGAGYTAGAASSSAYTAGADYTTGAGTVFVDTTPISEGSVVTKAELEAAKIAAAEKAREEAERAAAEARAAQEAAAAAIAARDAARAAKARVASSELNSAMEELLEVGEELNETVNKKHE